MTDVSTRTAGPAPTVGNTYTAIGVTDLLPGQPVRTSTVDATGVVIAEANAAASARVTGLIQGNSADDEVTHIQYAGPLNLTTAEWDALVTGQSGGLTPNAIYYLSSTVAGKLIATKPSAGGTIAKQIGVAISATCMLIQIGEGVLNS